MGIIDSNGPANRVGCLEKVKLEDAAKELGVSLPTLRSWLRHKVIPIGIADIQDGKSKWQYVVYRPWLDEFKRSINVSTEA